MSSKKAHRKKLQEAKRERGRRPSNPAIGFMIAVALAIAALLAAAFVFGVGT